jgi:hypothetical protein
VISRELQNSQNTMETLAKAKDLKALETSIKERDTASSASHAALKELCVNQGSKLASLQQSLESVASDVKMKVKDVEERVAGKANAKDLAMKVDSDFFNSKLSIVMRDLQGKAWSKSVEQIAQDTKQLAQTNKLLSSQVEIALRFVEWFSSRGEAYEHNYQVMEKHLMGLANQSKPTYSDFTRK